jgi:inhibitor of KinA
MADPEFPRFAPMGDAAVVIQLGDQIDQATFQAVRALAHQLDRRTVPGMLEYVAAFTTITVYYDPLLVSLDEFSQRLQQIASVAGTYLRDSGVLWRRVWP